MDLSYTESTLTSVTINNDDNIALGEASNITLTITNSLTLYSSLDLTLTQIDITIPAEFTIGSVCTSTSGTCVKFSDSIYRVTNVGLSMTNLNITLTDLQLNYFDPTSGTFKLVYTYNGLNVSVLESGVVLSPYCTSPCQRCDTTATACESCLPAPNTFIYYDPDVK